LEGRIDRDLKDAAEAKTIPTGDKGSYVAYGKKWANASNTPFRLYKHWTHEGGISTPLIIHYPKLIKEGKIIREVSHIIDVMPTVLELGQTTYPEKLNNNIIQPLEGLSLLPIISGSQWIGHDYLFWEHEGSRAVRTSKWKLVSEPEQPWELYDMENDRSELHDVSNSNPEVVKDLEQRYNQWATKVGVQ
jgi:arylsulfatase